MKYVKRGRVGITHEMEVEELEVREKATLKLPDYVAHVYMEPRKAQKFSVEPAKKFTITNEDLEDLALQMEEEYFVEFCSVSPTEGLSYADPVEAKCLFVCARDTAGIEEINKEIFKPKNTKKYRVKTRTKKLEKTAYPEHLPVYKVVWDEGKELEFYVVEEFLALCGGGWREA